MFSHRVTKRQSGRFRLAYFTRSGTLRSSYLGFHVTGVLPLLTKLADRCRLEKFIKQGVCIPIFSLIHIDACSALYLALSTETMSGMRCGFMRMTNSRCSNAFGQISRGYFRGTMAATTTSGLHNQCCSPSDFAYEKSTQQSATSAPALLAMRNAARSTFFIRPSR